MSYKKKPNYYEQKCIIYCLVECILQVMMVITFFLVFAPMLNSLTLDNNEKVTNQISKPFDTNLALSMTNLANGKVNLKFSKCFSANKFFFI